MTFKTSLWAFLLLSPVLCQDGSDRAAERELCKDKSAGELFRLSAGKRNCRNVVQCTGSGLQSIRCPPGLAFDLEKQTCDWRNTVTNCDKLTRERKAKPLLSTDEPICQANHLACGDGNCLEQGLFCNGVKDCLDGSDENACSEDDDPNRAPPCDIDICRLPDCFCSNDGTKVPGEFCPEGRDCKQVPQMVTIAFSDAVNNLNYDLYREMFNGVRLNPNGCDIKGTFFVSHKYTNYSAVEEMHMRGHEIAAHSITLRDKPDFWTKAGVEDWAKEMAGQRLIIEKFANISDNSVIGLRAPYLRVGGNNQFKMMEEQSFLYDSSITAALTNPPLWPYTMYFRMPHRCHGNVKNCPTRSHAVWEMVMNELDPREKPELDDLQPGCAIVDSCSTILSADQFYNFLTYNFYRHFDSNRAPFGLNFHAAWLKNNPEYFDAFLYWMDEIIEHHGGQDEVYFLTMTQVIQWIKNPSNIEDSKTFGPWQERCKPTGRLSCAVPNRCALSSDELPGEALYMHTCVRCPNAFPWFNDPTGAGF